MRDLLQRQERIILQEALHIPVIDVDPELEKLVRRRQLSIQPDGSSRGFAHFLPARRGEEWKGHDKGIAIGYSTNEFDPGNHVTPLIVSPDLEHTAIALEKHQKVIGLQQLVVKLEE